MKKKLLYIGHSYHNKTKSTQFLQDIFRTKYDVTIFDFDPYNNDNSIYQNLKGQYFDVVVCFQILPDRFELNRNVIFRHGAFFPMYDGGPPREDPIWDMYRDFQIINFSKSMHEEILSLGMSSHYIQYFPKPTNTLIPGDKQSLFVWQRVSGININTVARLIYGNDIKHIYVHKAVDPGQEFIFPPQNIAQQVQISEWFERKQDLVDLINSCAFYVSPRPTEGIGMSFLEAMSMGRCVLAPDNPTMNEYITHGQTGLLFDPVAPQPLDLSDCRAIQERAQKFIADGFVQWEKNKFNILDWLEAPLSTKKRIVLDGNIFCSQAIPYVAWLEGKWLALDIVKKCHTDPSIALDFYCDFNQKTKLQNFLSTYNIPYNIIYNESSNMEAIDIYISTLFPVPQHIENVGHILSFCFITDFTQFEYQDFIYDKTNYIFYIPNSNKHFIVTNINLKPTLQRYFPNLAESNIHFVSDLQLTPVKQNISSQNILHKYGIPSNTSFFLMFYDWDYCYYITSALQALAQLQTTQNFLLILVGDIPTSFLDSINAMENSQKIKKSLITPGVIPDDDLAELCRCAKRCILPLLSQGHDIFYNFINACGGISIELEKFIDRDFVLYSKKSFIDFYKKIFLGGNRPSVSPQYPIKIPKPIKEKNFLKSVMEELNNDFPPVSIITVIKDIIQNNRKKTFLQCLQSVFSQNYPGPVEHLIIDGDSTDGTIELLHELSKKYNFKWHSQADEGIYDAMNQGLAKASGTFVCFLNSDDFFSSSQAISSSIRALIRTKSDFSSADAEVIDPISDQILHLWSGNILQWVTGVYPCHQTIFCKRDTLLSLGGFDFHNSPFSADNDLMCKLYCSNYKYIYVPQTIVTFRTGGASKETPESTFKTRQEHIKRLFKVYGKAKGLSLSDCARLSELSSPASIKAVFPILLRLQDNDLTNFYFDKMPEKIVMIPENFPTYSTAKLVKYRILSQILWGKRKKHYQTKLKAAHYL